MSFALVLSGVMFIPGEPMAILPRFRSPPKRSCHLAYTSFRGGLVRI